MASAFGRADVMVAIARCTSQANMATILADQKIIIAELKQVRQQQEAYQATTTLRGEAINHLETRVWQLETRR